MCDEDIEKRIIRHWEDKVIDLNDLDDIPEAQIPEYIRALFKSVEHIHAPYALTAHSIQCYISKLAKDGLSYTKQDIRIIDVSGALKFGEMHIYNIMRWSIIEQRKNLERAKSSSSV